MRDGTLDAALERLHAYGPEYDGGLSNHAPMVVEALDHAGRSGDIDPWLDTYRNRLEPHPAPGVVIEQSARSSALGSASYPDWYTTFEHLINEHGWRAVAADWLDSLMPATIAQAGHGLLRTAHAIRSLHTTDTAPRRHELAAGLAYWAAAAHPFGPEPAHTGTRPIEQTWTALPQTIDAPDHRGAITDAVAALADSAPFRTLIDNTAVPANPDDTIATLIRLGASDCVAADPTAITAVAHIVTIAAASRQLLPLLNEPRAALLRIHQATASLHTTYGAPQTDPSTEPAAWPDLIDTAIESGDEHAIKLAIALADHDHTSPQPIHQAAAAQATAILAPRATVD